MDGQSKRRRALVGLFLAVLLAVPQAAFAAEPATAPTGFNEATGIYEMFFPVIGSVTYSDSFGDCRSGCSRTHEGNDLMGVKMQPVIAVADGTVGGDYSVSGGWFQGEGSCCAMTLEHDDGWSSWYIHLNNDTEGTDDGLGWGFAEGIAPGVHVGEHAVPRVRVAHLTTRDRSHDARIERTGPGEPRPCDCSSRQC